MPVRETIFTLSSNRAKCFCAFQAISCAFQAIRTRLVTRLLLLAVFAVLVSPLARSQSAGAPAPEARREIEALTRERETTRQRLESVEARATHLETELVVLLAVVTLVVAVLIGTTIYGEIRLKDSVKDMRRKAKEVTDRFPKLAEMERQCKSALSDLEQTLGKGEWLEERYTRLDVMQRQRILSVEHLIALEFVGGTTVGHLRGMANFYASKYKTEGLTVASDFDRALYYATLAIDRGGRRFQHLNDAGLLWLLHSEVASDPEPDLNCAAKFFEESRAKHAKQQRCYYNLGVILARRATAALSQRRTAEVWKIFEEVKQHLETALKSPNWELEPDPAMESLLHYNLACALCRVAQCDPHNPAGANTQDTRLDIACDHLAKASRFKQTKPDVVQTDFDDSILGDLYVLAQNLHYGSQVSAIRTQFQQTWANN